MYEYNWQYICTVYAEVNSSAWEAVSRKENQFRIVLLIFYLTVGSQTGHTDFIVYIFLVRVKTP